MAALADAGWIHSRGANSKIKASATLFGFSEVCSSVTATNNLFEYVGATNAGMNNPDADSNVLG